VSIHFIQRRLIVQSPLVHLLNRLCKRSARRRGGLSRINGGDVESAFARMLKGDVKYRFVIDMQATRW